MNKTYFNKLGVLTILSALFMFSCTNLEIDETDSLFTETGVFNGVPAESSLQQLYNDVYAQLGNQENEFALMEVSTDELLVPTRGTDWGDNGLWRTLHAHTWTAAHPHVLNAWNNQNQNVFRASEIIDSRSTPTPQQEAEARFLRAFAMFNVMDLYGQVPFREVDEGPEIDPRVLSRTEAYDFILNDLTTAMPNLASRGPSAETNFASKATANFLLAKLYLNAHIYKGTGTPDPADMTAVINAVDAIEADGYALADGYFDIFKEDVDTETIWWLRTSVGNRIWNGMHYNIIAPDNTGGGWNGFSTLAEFYDLFEGDANENGVGSGQEERRGFVPDATNADATNLGIGYGFLLGLQYDTNGNLLTDRIGNPLNFTKELPGLIGNTENTGIRVIKYHPVNGSFTSHEIMFRYADALLMKAEAQFNLGSGDPLALVNQLRGIRDADPLGSLTAQDLLDERGRELYIEFWRRNDLVRFDQFTRDWEFKDPSAVGDTNRNLFPIPTVAILSNPNLVQNPGY
ncbi:RagB/SusD family nutrient uptake outer membrane protein [Ascidiimonas sp. W6]|uniref:RagB/SusD family nutrient uptake outer membrane protein n=1 Tax=Ascidiimonas meishanensis TaxID=3128903 RepID=UPI0030EBF1D3